MGLLKGSNIRYTEGQAIIGADIFTPPDDPDPTVATAIVPRAPQFEAPEGAGDTEPEEWERGLGDNLDDLFEQGHVQPEEESDDWAAPIHEYDRARDHELYAAREEADLDANQFGEQIQGAAGGLMETALEDARAVLEEANPDGDFDEVGPYVQRRVAVELDLELMGVVSEIRWTHLQQAEQKVVEEAGQAAAELEDRYPPETFAELLVRREEVLSEARLEAERLMMEAMTRSAETMAQAEQAQAQTMLELESQRERILTELRQQAYKEGYHEGKATGEAEAATYVQEALQKLNEIAIAFPAAVKQNEEKLVTLALEIASKVIQEEIALQPEIVQRTVEMALKRVSDLEQVVVKVNPLDLDLILPKQEAFKQLMPDVQNFSIEGSHTIQRGGCLIETNSGSINATINAQLGIVEEIFRNVRAEYEDEVLGDLS